MTAANLTSRQRSSETKKQRTRQALLKAALDLFTERGWHATRMQDIAEAADVTCTTAYNHFPTKPKLLLAAFTPLLDELAQATDRAIEAGHPPITAIARHLLELSRLARTHSTLPACAITALPEPGHHPAGTTTEPGQAHLLALLSRPLTDLIFHGQQTGELQAALPAADTGLHHTSALLLRALTRPGESAEDTAAATLSQLLPVLTTEPAQSHLCATIVNPLTGGGAIIDPGAGPR
ncbi:TetR/AcrR family transcriptional regulator [Actinomadura graeca]|uniref:TetR/AcrR family transcriptional regulator n=1 Tax=Actinomadura graeca TaxID=2750812 RepID=A0ABX8R5N7_9ACTN|nr:TetR/AcrR family transcriptional regulator [Actinomadura graeca]QXJ25841.1 TetR/AcrR family transcriptional regulator [Actinomadura graeca]